MSFVRRNAILLITVLFLWPLLAIAQGPWTTPANTNGKLKTTSTAADSITSAGGVTAGTGAVAIINATGKIPAISSTYFASTSASASDLTSGTVPPARLGSGTPSASTYLLGNSTWASVPSASPWTLLKAGSGTSTAAGATILDSVSISGLTVLDQIAVSFYGESVTQDTASVGLYNSTDSISIIAGTFTAGSVPWHGLMWLQGSKRTATDFLVNPGTNTFSGRAAISMSTAFYGATWTLAYRHGGVTAGV